MPISFKFPIKFHISSYWWGYAAMVGIWALVTGVIVPEPPGADIFIMKDAGVNLALGYGYVSCAVPDNQTLHYAIHASYPPLYPVLFTVYTRLFGLGIIQNAYFNLALQSLRNAALLYIGLLFIEERKSRWGLVVFCGATVAMPLSIPPDRPEDLSMALSLMALGLVCQPQLKGVVGASLLNLINCLASPFGGLTSTVYSGGLLLSKLSSHSVEMKKKELLATFLLPFVGLLVTVVLLTRVINPDLLYRFMNHATQSGGASFLFSGQYFHQLFYAAKFSYLTANRELRLDNYLYTLVMIMAAVVAWRQLDGHKRWIFFAVWMWSLTPGLIFLGSFAYKNYIVLLLTILTAGLIASTGRKRLVGPLLVGGLVLVFFILAPSFGKDFIGRCLLTFCIPFHPEEVHRYIPADPRGTFFVGTSSVTYFELKPTNKIYDETKIPLDPAVRYLLIVEDPNLLARVHKDHPTYPQGFNPAEWEVIYRPQIKLGKIAQYFVTYPLLRSSAFTIYRRKE